MRTEASCRLGSTRRVRWACEFGRPGGRVHALVPLFIAGLVVASGCQPEPISDPPSGYSFAVFGDGPYEIGQGRRYARMIRELNASPVTWLIHVGDILWYPCSDELFADRLASFSRIERPVIYTPGDNEWTDCHGRLEGGFDPLERLARLRSVYFSDAERTLGGRPMTVESQASGPQWPEMVENVRWEHDGVVFATVHLVGSWNGRADFEGRTSASDDEATRRTEAAADWLTETFVTARRTGARGVVIAMHANPLLDQPPENDYRKMYEPFLAALEHEASRFERPILVIHGDTHRHRVDRPLVDRVTGRPLEHVTRLETFGSPDIGWIRVLVDTTSVELFKFVPRKIPVWQLW